MICFSAKSDTLRLGNGLLVDVIKGTDDVLVDNGQHFVVRDTVDFAQVDLLVHVQLIGRSYIQMSDKEDLDDHFDEDEDNLHPHQPTYDDEYEERPQEKLEHLIMDEVLNLEKRDDNISEEVEEKLKELLERMPRKNEEEILTVRMHELALSKILVFTHGKSDFRLVKAHYHIGEAYLNYKCYEQAIDHLTVALKKNSKLTEIKETKVYHSYMLTTLSRCYFEINSYEDALQVLNRAYDIQQNYVTNDGTINNTETLQLMSNCYLKLKNFKLALQFIESTLELINKISGESKDYALTNVLKSKIHFEEGNLVKGIDQIKRSIDIMTAINYQNKQEIADLYQTLATYYETYGEFDKQIQALSSRYELLQEIFGHADKKALKAKRTIAMTLLKREKLPEAIQELEEVQEIEQKVYGENSVQVGKTMKVLGSVHMKNSNMNQAEHYLKKAQKILHEQGMPKLVKEIKTKLNFLRETKDGSGGPPLA